MEDSVDFYDEKYTVKIRTEILNGLDDLKKNSDFLDEFTNRERQFLNDVKINVLNSKDDLEEVERLSNLIDIYDCLYSISNFNRYANNEVERIKKLLKRD